MKMRDAVQILQCFQSIGVTKDWRLSIGVIKTLTGYSFQSIGVTKDWRHALLVVTPTTVITFPINRRHQGLATFASS